MKYTSTLIVVKDMEKSKTFYHDVLGLEVVSDFGANVTLTGGISLQTADTWKSFIHRQERDIIFGNNAGELYFEEDDIDAFVEKLNSFDIDYVHPLIEHSWGQRAVRFYDPDKHIIEVGENLVMVIKRFMDSGLSASETAERMDVPVEYVLGCLGSKEQ
jgi:catechol 2,3-dioxygenase-like lactoylglutathione lyase family enzyme